jgi:hypothetical protein
VLLKKHNLSTHIWFFPLVSPPLLYLSCGTGQVPFDGTQSRLRGLVPMFYSSFLIVRSR